MRFAGFSIGHSLPFGGYGRAYFSNYNPRQIDHTTLVREGSAAAEIGTAFKLAMFLGFMAFLIWCRMRYAP